jgi:hypothetical protein
VPFEKQSSTDPGKVTVTFRVPAEGGATAVELIGEFTAWSPVAMASADGGDHVVTMDLDAGFAYRFRYRLDGERWVNEWAADGYVANDYGSDDSVIDLTAVESSFEAPVEPRPSHKPARAARKGGNGVGTDGRESKAANADATATKPKRASRRESNASTD